SIETFREALQLVADGKVYFGPAAQEALSGNHSHDGLMIESVSPREKEVLKLIIDGLSTKQVADRLQISFKTADNHRTNLMKKLEVHDVISLTRKACKLGLAL